MRNLLKSTLATALCLPALGATAPAHAAETPFLGEIIYVGFNFCPRGWADANGQLLQISENTALFSLLGTAYGGDGIRTFALPDLRGRVAVGDGQIGGFPSEQVGQVGGASEVARPVTASPNYLREKNPPYLVVNACIALQGIFPSRN